MTTQLWGVILGKMLQNVWKYRLNSTLPYGHYLFRPQNVCVGWDIKPYSFTRVVFVLGTLPTPPARMKCSSVPVHVVVSGLVFSPWDLYQTSVISRMDTPMQATPTPQFRYIGTVFQDTLWSAPWSCSEILQSVNLGVPRSFAVSGPTSWNSITQSFRDATPTLGQFQRRL